MQLQVHKVKKLIKPAAASFNFVLLTFNVSDRREQV